MNDKKIEEIKSKYRINHMTIYEKENNHKSKL